MNLAKLTLLLALLGATVARAFPTSAQIATAFAAIDTTGNGAINGEEWERASFALFRAADLNKDDFIAADELQGSSFAQDTFLRADADHDGRLSVDEFMALRRTIFTIADIDRDDFLLPVEFDLLLVMEQVGWVDRNENGRIELSELRVSLEKAFDQLDADRDGMLSPDEAAYLRSSDFKKFDRDEDSRLSRQEYVAGYRALLLAE